MLLILAVGPFNHSHQEPGPASGESEGLVSKKAIFAGSVGRTDAQAPLLTMPAYQHLIQSSVPGARLQQWSNRMQTAQHCCVSLMPKLTQVSPLPASCLPALFLLPCPRLEAVPPPSCTPQAHPEAGCVPHNPHPASSAASCSPSHSSTTLTHESHPSPALLFTTHPASVFSLASAPVHLESWYLFLHHQWTSAFPASFLCCLSHLLLSMKQLWSPGHSLQKNPPWPHVLAPSRWATPCGHCPPHHWGGRRKTRGKGMPGNCAEKVEGPTQQSASRSWNLETGKSGQIFTGQKKCNLEAGCLCQNTPVLGLSLL